MVQDVIIIRKAEAADAESLWRILHAEGRQWDMERIHANLPQLFVLACGTKIIGVLHGKRRAAGKAEVAWIAAHPMFPENPVQLILSQAIALNPYSW